MKITKQRLNRIIKEETEALIGERQFKLDKPMQQLQHKLEGVVDTINMHKIGNRSYHIDDVIEAVEELYEFISYVTRVYRKEQRPQRASGLSGPEEYSPEAYGSTGAEYETLKKKVGQALKLLQAAVVVHNRRVAQAEQALLDAAGTIEKLGAGA